MRVQDNKELLLATFDGDGMQHGGSWSVAEGTCETVHLWLKNAVSDAPV